MVLTQLEDVRNAQLYNVRCRVKGYLHGNGIAEQLPDAAVLAEVYARPVERRVDEGLPPSTAVQVLAEPLVQLVQCPFVALKDALCIRRAAIDAVLQIQLSEIEQHDDWLAILANEAKQKRLLLVQPRI